MTKPASFDFVVLPGSTDFQVSTKAASDASGQSYSSSLQESDGASMLPQSGAVQ